MALAFATIERPQVAQRLIASARLRFPSMPIYVADQSLDVAAMTSFYAHMQVNTIRMPYDAGVCASRNRLAASIAEEYFVLCDDDFVFGDRTDFSEALRILRHHPDIGVVGGRLYDYDGREEYTRSWELFLHLDSVQRTLTSIPIYNYAPRAMEMGATRFYLCDAVMNFAVMRRSIFRKPAVRWDERFKSNGEHEDFFLNLKLNSSVRVAYLPTMVAYHHHPEEFVSYRSRLRDRLEGWKQMFAKWDIDQHLEIGLGVRTIDDFNALVDADDAKARFFLNDNLSLRRDSNVPALLVGLGPNINTVGILDSDGEPDRSTPNGGRLLIEYGTGKLMVGPDSGSPEPAEGKSDRDRNDVLHSRYGLTPSGPLVDFSHAANRFVFRYNPIQRPEADFILWYRVAVPEKLEVAPQQIAVVPQKAPPAKQNAPLVAQKASLAAQKGASGGVGIHVRWFADNGQVLIWESSPSVLDIRRTEYWAPLFVQAPACPNDCSYMRFEVVTSGSPARRQLATGFLFKSRPPRPAAGGRASSAVLDALDVLALTPWSRQTTGATLPAVDLDEIICARWGKEITGKLCVQSPALFLLQSGRLIEFDHIFVFGWHGLGPPLSIVPLADGAGSDQSAAAYVALPLQAAPELRLAGYAPDLGFRTIGLRIDSHTVSSSALDASTVS